MRIALFLAAFFVAATAHAACSDDAAALAQKYGITASLTTDTAAPASAEAKTEQLAKSGGVIAPPPTGDMATAQPAVPNPEPMQTAPTLPAQTANGATVDKSKTAGAATDSQAASLLQAAREAGMKGNEDACRQRLGDARALLEKAPEIKVLPSAR